MHKTKFKIKNRKRFVITILLIILLIGICIFSFMYKEYSNTNNINKSININYINSQHDFMNSLYQKIPNKDKIDKIIELQNQIKTMNQQIQNVDNKIETINNKLNISSKYIRISFYDLSKQSCGKSPSSKEYGISRGGYNLRGKTYKTARIVAVDPKVIPLHSQVLIQFKDEKYKYLDGIYICGDTGRLIKGNRIDVYMGENQTKKCLELGMTDAKVIILKRGDDK